MKTKKKTTNWDLILGCMGKFDGHAKFHIMSSSSGVRPPVCNVEFGEYLVIKVDRNYVYITGDSRWVNRVKKKNVKIIK